MDPITQNAPTPPVELGLFEISTNLALSIVLGLVVAMVYRQTHKGLSYSQSFTLTIVFVTVIVAIVMMVIENSIARAFALVGALSIIRFRTVVKDTKDTAFVFLGLAVGMAAGTSNYLLGGLGTAVVGILAIVLHRTNFGALYKSEFILRFRYDKDTDSAAYLAAIQQNARRSNMLHIEPSGDGSSLLLTYDIELMEGQAAEELASALGVLKGISEVTLIASKNDVDY
tara:strand:+ start:4072 stop:4755 length:684 start_codon:yes stop_codon:yes gene_type:complete